MTRSQLEEIVKIRRDVVVEVGRCFGYYLPLNSFICQSVLQIQGVNLAFNLSPITKEEDSAGNSSK
jgi:hypothetical protein